MRNEERTMHGLLVLDKPAGPTSHDMVAAVRRLTGWKKVGHTGTLDPMATGVLPLLAGRATRLARFFSASSKEYEAEVRLGWATDTYDALGSPMRSAGAPSFVADAPPSVVDTPPSVVDAPPSVVDAPPSVVGPGASAPGLATWPSPSALAALLDRFRGTFLQAPPAFSAKKVNGVRAYALARGGEPIEPKAVEVTLHDVVILACEGDRLRLRVRCSAGFYVRSFAHALGLAVGPGAHLSALRRTRSGDCEQSAALPWQALEADPGLAQAHLVPLDRLLGHLPSVVVTPDGAARTRHGSDLRPCDVAAGSPAPGPLRVVDQEGTLLAIAGVEGGAGVLHPDIVLV